MFGTHSRVARLALSTVACALALVASTSVASACGGFFCSSSPVDQEAERVLFVQHDENTIHQYVEIVYEGDPGDFAWVLPVPGTPELDVWHAAAFQALDAATQPTFQPPWECFPQADGDFAAAGGAEEPNAAPPADERGVQVLDRQEVGPFESVTITGRDPELMVEWLNEEGYRVVDEMTPFIALYLDDGLNLIAMKLKPGEESAAIQPVRLEMEGQIPTIPLRLTSIAAVLEMGVKVFILGDERYRPVNAEEIEIDDKEIRFEGWGSRTNYLPLVARKVDEKGGKAFITEFAGDADAVRQNIQNGGVPGWADEATEKAFESLLALLETKPYLTRLYTRLSPEEMSFDPGFFAAGGEDVSNFHDLSDMGPDACGEIENPDPCEFIACGAGGECFEMDREQAPQGAGGEVGCACADGAVARAGVDDAGRPVVACGDARMNFMPVDADLQEAMNAGMIDPPTFGNPCAGDPCGDLGQCVALNGTATCECMAGTIAIGRWDDQGRAMPTCALPAVEIPMSFYTDITLVEPALPYPGKPGASVIPGNGNGTTTVDPTTPGEADGSLGCDAAPSHRGPAAALWGLLLLGALRRRRA